MKKLFIKTFLLVFVGANFLMFFPQLVTYAYNVLFQSEQNFARNTSIGTVLVEGLSPKDAETKVLKAAEQWQKSQAYTLTFADQSVQIPLQNFSFVVPESIASAEAGVANTLYVNVDANDLTNQLIKLVGSDFLENINQQALKAELEKQAGLFASTKTISITHFLRGEAANRQVISSANISIHDVNSLQQWVEQHPQLTIPAHANYSFVQNIVGKQTEFSDDFLSKAASALYEASLATNLEIIERSISTELPEGYKLGYEARVNRSNLDLILYNPNDYDMTVQFQVENGNTLIAEITGFVTGKSYKVVERNRITYPYKQIIQYSNDPTSKPQSGKEGYSIQIYRNIYDASGIKIKTSLIAKDFYLPVNEVVVKDPVSDTTLPGTTSPNTSTTTDSTTSSGTTTTTSVTGTVQ